MAYILKNGILYVKKKKTACLTKIAQNVFETKDGDLVSKSGAYAVDREKTEIEI